MERQAYRAFSQKLVDNLAQDPDVIGLVAAGSDDAFHVGQFLTNLLVGIGRYRRGERLSAHRFVKNQAVYHLVTLLVRHVPSAQGHLADNIDPTRRFERVHPELVEALRGLMLQEVPEAASGLLELFEKELGRELVGVPAQVFQVVAERVRFG